MTAAQSKFKDYESALNRLEEITAELESGDVNLESSIKLYTEGMEVVAYCTKKLSEAEKKITVLKEKNQKLVEVPFDDEGEENGD